MMKNHGSLVTAKTIDSAFFNQYILQRACEIQLAIQSTDNPFIPIEKDVTDRNTKYNTDNQSDRAPPLLWSAMKRKLDRINPGYDT